MAHGDAREENWRGNWRMQWVASTLHNTSEHGVSSITTANAHTPAASSRLNWRPTADLNRLVRFVRKTKSCFCACAITFQTQSNKYSSKLCAPSILSNVIINKLYSLSFYILQLFPFLPPLFSQVVPLIPSFCSQLNTQSTFQSSTRFRIFWPCIVNIRWRERTNKMQLIRCLLSNFLSSRTVTFTQCTQQLH